MIDDDLDLDPLEIHSWEAYCMACIAQGKIDVFINKLSAYIHMLNEMDGKALGNYVTKIQGEIVAEELRKQHGLYKPPRSKRVYKFI